MSDPIEREDVIGLIKAEPECPGPLPMGLYLKLKQMTLEEVVRLTVRGTKKCLIDRVKELPCQS